MRTSAKTDAGASMGRYNRRTRPRHASFGERLKTKISYTCFLRKPKVSGAWSAPLHSTVFSVSGHRT